jgi:MFS family permease
MGSFGDGLYAYILPYYITQNLDAGPVEVGMLYAVVGFVAALTLFFAGMIADKYDRKKIMVVGWMAWIPAPLIFSFTSDWLQMLPGMILWGFWLGGPTSTAYIVTAANTRKLTLTFTALSSAWSFGYIFSPALGGYMAEEVGMPIVFYLASFFYALACLTLLFISSQKARKDVKQKTKNTKSSFLEVLKSKELLKFSLLFAAIMFIVLLFRPFVPQFLADIYYYGDLEIGIFGSSAFLGSAVLGLLLGRMGDKWGKSYALAASMILCSVSLALLLLVGNFYILIITFFILGSSYLTWSLMGAIVGAVAPEPIRARWISIPQTVSMFSSIIAPYIGGILYDVSSYYPFVLAIIVTILLALISFVQVFE